MTTIPALCFPGFLELLANSGRVDRQAEFDFRRAQMFFSPGAVALHVVVIGSAGALHLMDGFVDVFVSFPKVTPVANLRLDNRTGGKRQHKRENGKSFLHYFSPQFVSICPRTGNRKLDIDNAMRSFLWSP